MTKHYVLLYGLVKQYGFLSDVANLPSELSQVYTLKVITINQHLAILGVIKSFYELHYGAFA